METLYQLSHSPETGDRNDSSGSGTGQLVSVSEIYAIRTSDSTMLLSAEAETP